MKKYEQLFRIDFKHDYFSDGVLKNVLLDPTPATKQLMRQYDLRLQKNKQGVIIYCGLNKGESMAASLGKARKLSFLLKVEDPSFINYTELPLLGQENKKYFFSNVKDSTGPDATIRSLSKIDFVSEQDGLPFYPLFYQHQLPSNTKQVLFNLAEFGQNALSQDQLSDWQLIPGETSPNEEASILQINFNQSSWGKYELNISGEESLVFGVMPGNAMPSTFGMIEIVTKGEISQHYEIAFQARKTTWRYYIINKSEIDTTTIRINKGSANQVNGDAEEVPLAQPIEQNNKKLSNGDEATLLELIEGRTLKERPSELIHLSLIGSDGKEIKVDLPYVSPQQIIPEIVEIEKIDENGDKKLVKEISHVYSDIYVYL